MILEKFNEFEFSIALEEDYNEIADLLKISFTNHNIFQKPTEDILEYLSKVDKYSKRFFGGFIVGKIESDLISVLLLKRKSQDISGRHYYWKINHLAVLEEYRRRGIASAMVKLVDKMIVDFIQKKSFLTSKLEAHFVGKELKEFYEKNEFRIEGEIRSRYRYNEIVYIAGKEYTTSKQ